MSRGKTGLAALAALALWAAATPSRACTPKVFPELDYPPNAPGEEEIAQAYFDADEAGDQAAAEAAAQRWLDFNLRVLGEGNWFVGSIYFNLGFAQGAQKKDAQALASFTKARDIFAKTLGADHSRTLNAATMLSVAQFKVGRFAEARATIKAVSQATDATACPDSDAALAALKTWGQTAGNGEVIYAEAAQVYGELIARRLRRFGESDPDLPALEFDRGVNLVQDQRSGEALPVLMRAAARFEAAKGAASPEALAARVWQGEALLQLGRYQEAQDHMTAVMAAARRADPKGDATIDAEDLHLRILMARADYATAPKVAQDLLTGRIRDFGEDDRRTLAAMQNFASLAETLVQVAAAEGMRRRLLTAAIRLEGPDSELAANITRRIAELITDDDRPVEAEAFLKPLWQRMEAGPTTQTSVEVGSAMGLILRDQERYADAESLFRRLQQRAATTLGRDDPTTLDVTTNLAIVLGDTGRQAEAEALHREVWAARKVRFGPTHPETLRSALNVALTLDAPDRFKERVELLLATEEAAHGKLSSAHPVMISIMNTMTQDLVRAGQPAAAAGMLAEMRTLYIQMFGRDHPRTRTTTLRLARALGLQDKHAEAEPLFAELVEIDTRRAVPGLPPNGELIAATNGLGLARTMQGRAREGYPYVMQAVQAVYTRSRDSRTVGAGAEESRQVLIDNRYVFNALIRSGWAYAHEP